MSAIVDSLLSCQYQGEGSCLSPRLPPQLAAGVWAGEQYLRGFGARGSWLSGHVPAGGRARASEFLCSPASPACPLLCVALDVCVLQRSSVCLSYEDLFLRKSGCWCGVHASSHLPRVLTNLGTGFGAGKDRGWRCEGSALPAPFPSVFPSLLLGVPLLFVIPWGIVKYLYEDEG